MHDLKQKIIAKINDAKPAFKKSALAIRGLGGEVVEADEQGITCKLINGKSESIAWLDLGAKAKANLLQLAVERTSADDWLAAALIALASDDVPLAEKCFDQARSLGTNIDRYLAPLASAAFARAKGLIDAGKWPEAQKRLDELGAKYAATPWLRENRARVDDTFAAVKAGLHEVEAEKLYAEAAELSKKHDLFGVRALLEKLKGQYPDTPAVTDAARKPGFAELELAVANLGKKFTVRLDGKGDFKSIQAAIDAAPPNSLIEVGDDGPYTEPLHLGKEKEGLTLRAAKGCWPVVTSQRVKEEVPTLVSVEAPGTTIERLVLVHAAPSGDKPCCLIFTGGLRLRSTIVFMPSSGEGSSGLQTYSGGGPESHAEGCLFVTKAFLVSSVDLRNCLSLRPLSVLPPSKLRFCTILAELQVQRPGTSISDCIVSGMHIFDAALADLRVQNLDVFAETRSEPKDGYFRAPPQFVDPANLDCRLLPTSPCRGKASDGGDIGCRYTPEMIELCKQALELRRKGILKF